MSEGSALFQSGMDLHEPSTTRKEEQFKHGSFIANDERLDHFIVKNGIKCAGTHLIIDLYGAKNLDSIPRMRQALLDCVEKAGATLLHIHLHHFEPDGISGVAVLAESHISVHSWPENDYAAFDVFMCGDAKPELCVDILKDAFQADRVEVQEYLRGKGVYA